MNYDDDYTELEMYITDLLRGKTEQEKDEIIGNIERIKDQWNLEI